MGAVIANVAARCRVSQIPYPSRSAGASRELPVPPVRRRRISRYRLQTGSEAPVVPADECRRSQDGLDTPRKS